MPGVLRYGPASARFWHLGRADFAAYLCMHDGAEEIGIRLLLVDELGLFRASLARFLASEPGFEVVECGSCSEALDILRSSKADAILSDFEIGGEPGDDFIAAARSAGFQGHFLIVADHPIFGNRL
jgi:ActR/RegA family two-component response regulator